MKTKKKWRKLGATSKSFEKSREQKHKKTRGKGKKMKKSPYEIVQRTRGRDTAAGGNNYLDGEEGNNTLIGEVGDDWMRWRKAANDTEGRMAA